MPFQRKRNLFDDPDDEEQDDEESGAGGDDESDDEEEPPSLSSPSPTETTRPSLSNRFTSAFESANQIKPGPASERFSKFLETEQPPTNVKPGAMSRLAAILGGASEGYFGGGARGVQAAQNILDQPTRKAMAAYELKGKNLEKSAELEEKHLGRAASFARSAMTDIHNQITEQTAQQVAADRAAHWTAQDKAASDKARLSGFTHIVGSDGHLWFVRPTENGIEQIDGGKRGESIPEKSKRLLIEAQQKESAIGTREKDVEAARQKNRQTNLETQAANAKTLETQRQQGRAGTPQNQNIQALLRMQKILAINGEKAMKYFTIDPNTGRPLSLKPGDPSDETYKQIYQYIYKGVK